MPDKVPSPVRSGVQGGFCPVSSDNGKKERTGAARGHSHHYQALCFRRKRLSKGTQSQAGSRCGTKAETQPPLF